jgi:tetratricopeptide (TPR) repeat protein
MTLPVRFATGMLALNALVWSVGCSRSPESSRSAAPGNAAVTSQASATPPSPVALPDLTSVAGPVQQQIRERFDAMSRAVGDTSTSNADRARRYAELGHVLLASTFFDEAVLCYRHAEGLQPAEAAWPYLRGHASLRKGDRDEAAAAFERTTALKPDYVPAMVWVGDVYLDLGRAESAQQAFARALAREPESAAALYGAGRAALARSAYAEAVQYMEHALRVDPRATAIHYPLAMAYRATGQRERAEALLQRRGTSAPELRDPILQDATVVPDSAVSHEAVGMQALRRQDWPGAIEAFKRGLAVAPDDPSLRYWMASAMIAGGDAAGAEREFQAVVRAHPDYANAHFSLGAIFDQQGRRAEAQHEYETAVRYAPNLPDARLRLANSLRLAGQLRPAFLQYEEAVKLDPRSAEAWIGGAQTLIALREPAQDWIERGRRLHPNRREWDQLDATTK